MKYIDNIIKESTTSVDSVDGKNNLLALTRATTKLIYHDLVATQPVIGNSIATLYGIKYKNPNDDLTFATGATYTGTYGKTKRQDIEIINSTNAEALKKGDNFLFNDVVFKSLVDSPFNAVALTDLDEAITDAVALATIRMCPESEVTELLENTSDLAEGKFEVRKWQANVKSRKIKTEVTVELAQDMEANGFDAPTFFEDLLATEMAEEINKDITQSLITVSKRLKIKGVTDSGVLDLSKDIPSAQQGRDLYHYICEMGASIQKDTSYSATYVVASSRCAAMLASSGWLKVKDDQPLSAYGVLNNGLVLYCDNTTPMDYVVVGVKDFYGDNEMIGSLFYAPYVEGIKHDETDVDHIGAYKVINDPDSLQPKILLMVRYALVVNPYTMGLTDEEVKIVDCSNFDDFIGQSKMSVLLSVKLPKVLK